MITLRHHDFARYTIAIVALVILAGAITFSKRATSGFGESSGLSTPAVGAVEG